MIARHLQKSEKSQPYKAEKCARNSITGHTSVTQLVLQKNKRYLAGTDNTFLQSNHLEMGSGKLKNFSVKLRPDFSPYI